MRTFATKQPSNQDAAHQKPVRATPKPIVRSLSTGLTGSAMLQRKPSCACGGECPRCQEEVLLQTKLKISELGDQYEQEADRIADQVMQMPELSVQQQVEPQVEEQEERLQTKPLAEQIMPLGQRQTEPMEEEEETLQTKTTSGESLTVSASLQNRINALRGNGQPLPQSERAFFEPRFGHDFSQVRVHTDSQAAETAQALNARAFTLGQDIVFGQEQYQPSVSEVRRLLAHELTHVVQQGNDNVSRRSSSMQMIQRQPVAPPPPQPQQINQGNRTVWRQRVNNAVRTHFSLSGPGLTSSRVRFVSQSEFTSRIPASAIPELLLDLFLSPPSGSKMRDILRHHRMGLASITRLRRFIADRIATGSFEFSVLDPVQGTTTVQTITPRELVAENVAGFTSTGGARSGRSVLVQIPSDVETLVHEACHFYVHSQFRDWANNNPDQLMFGFRKSSLLMEGFAEYFARQVMEANSADFGSLRTRAYQPAVEVVQRLVVTMGEQSARRAYFEGDAAALRRLEQAIQLNEQTHPDLLVPSFMIP